MAQELLDLIPKRITQEGWPEAAVESIDAKIREDPTVLREDPLYPFHRMLSRRVPLSVVKTCLDLDPNLLTLKNEQGQLPVDLAARSHGTVAVDVFELIFQASREVIPDVATRVSPHDGSTLLYRALARVCHNVQVLESIYQANPAALMLRSKQGNLPIHVIRRIGVSLPAVRFMIEKNPSLLVEPDVNGHVLLHKVFADRKVDEAFRFLIEANPAAASVLDQQGNLPLHFAVSLYDNNGVNLDNIHALLRAYPNATGVANSRGYYPLHKSLVSHRGKQDISLIKLLIKEYPLAVQLTTQGATTEEDPVQGIYDGYLPLHLACRNRMGLEIIQTLVEAYPESVSIPTSRLGVLPFHIACAVRSELPILQYLAGLFPKAIQTVDHRGCYPLHHTSFQSPNANAWLFSEYPEAISHQDNIGMLPIHLLLAAQLKEESKAVLDRMISEYPKSLEVPTDRGFLALHYAVAFESSEREEVILKLLQAYPQAASHSSKEGKLPLHALCASYNPKDTVVEAILEAYPASIQTANIKGQIPLHTACAAAQKLPFIKKLVELFPSAISVATTNGRLPLHVACEYRCDLDVIQYLADLSPDALTTESECGRFPLHYACAYRSSAMPTRINDGKAYPENDYPTKEETLLKMRHMGAAFEGEFGCPIPGQGTVEWITKEFPQAASHTDRDGWTPLHAACANCLYQAGVEALLEAYPAAVDIRDNEGWLPLHCAVAFGYPREIVQKVIDRDPPTMKEWELPLRFDCCIQRQGKGPIVDRLLAANPESIRVADNEGWLPLHSAVASGTTHQSLRDCYKTHFVEAYATPTSDGSLPLHIFAAKRSTNLDSVEAKKLIELNEAALEAMDSRGRTPLDIARDK